MEQIVLSDFFTTKSQANDFNSRLSAFAANIYDVGFNLEKNFEAQFGPIKRDKFLTLIRENEIPVESTQALNKFVTRVQETISSMEVASLTLAIEPNDELLKAISDWFFLNLKKQVLLEILVDSNLIAGAIVSYNGKLLDSSIKSVFDNICVSNLN